MEVPKGKTRELIAEDSYNATIVGLIDKGTQPSNDPKFKDTRRILVLLEVDGERDEEGNAFVLFKDYNFIDSPKSKLTMDLGNTLKVDMSDIETALGKTCLVEVKHSENGLYANVTKISALPKGSQKLRKPMTPFRTFFLDKSKFDKDVFDSLGENLRAKIAASPEYVAVVSKSAPVKNGNQQKEKAGKKK
jgi:hypothetical protein